MKDGILQQRRSRISPFPDMTKPKMDPQVLTIGWNNISGDDAIHFFQGVCENDCLEVIDGR